MGGTFSKVLFFKKPSDQSQIYHLGYIPTFVFYCGVKAEFHQHLVTLQSSFHGFLSTSAPSITKLEY